MGKKFPVGTPLRTSETTEQLSLAVAVPKELSRLLSVTPPSVSLGPVVKRRPGGAMTVGGTSSTTVTSAVQELDKPRSSETVRVTLCAPRPSGPDWSSVSVIVSPESSSEEPPSTSDALRVYWQDV